MFKRILLTFTFVAAVGAAGVGLASKAEAHGGYANYYGYRNNYHGFPPVYPSHFAAGYTYVPPVVIYPGGGHWHDGHQGHHRHHGHRGHGRHHHHHGHHDHHGRGGVSFSIGF